MILKSADLIAAPVLPDCLVSIVVPVRDESEHICKTVESLARQVDLRGSPLDSRLFEVIVLANNCSDDSFKLADDCRKKFPTLRLQVKEIFLAEECANIGFVRGMLMNEAARRLKSNRFGGGIILTTDGDTRVAENWIAQNIYEIENGADAVGGRILLDDAELAKLNAPARSFHLQDENYRLLAAEFEWLLDELPHQDFPRHHQHFNGSFAVTTAAFERAGGVPEVKFLEDVAFYHALLRIDARVRHSPNVRVFTSARICGRTVLGLSTQLCEWKLMGENNGIYLVESPRSIESRIAARKLLRKLWENFKAKNSVKTDALKTAAGSLGISEKRLVAEIKQNKFFGSLTEKISREQRENGGENSSHDLIPVEKAILELERRLKEIRPQNQLFSQTA